MKQKLIGLMALMTLMACAKEEAPGTPGKPEGPDQPVIGKVDLQFNAEASATTKTSLTADDQVFWTEGDAISVFSAAALESNEEFTSSEISGSAAKFSGQAMAGDRYYAVYPYAAENRMEGNTLSMTIPSVQPLLNGSFANGINPSVAVSEGTSMHFRNVAALVSFKVPQLNGSKIVRAVFKGNEGEKIAGEMNVDMAAAKGCAVPGVGASAEVTLEGNFQANEVYYIAIAPTLFTTGINLSLYDEKGQSYSISGRMSVKTEAGKILPLGEFGLEPDGMSIYVKPNGTGNGSSWADATTLVDAIAKAEEGNTIHLAAGVYLPEVFTQSTAFVFTKNVNLIGGYPADATEGAVTDLANKTILSGNKKGRVLLIAAPKPASGAMEISNIVIADGLGNAGTETLEQNGASGIKDGRGAGVVVLNSKVIFRNCEIAGNYTYSAPGLYNAEGAETELIGCYIHHNTGYDNGSNIWNSYAKLIVKNCEFVENINTKGGVGGAIYALGETSMKSVPTMTYVYNSVFKGNSVANEQHDKIYLRGGGIYSREGSKTIVVNSTFHQNKAGTGSAISLYGTHNNHSYMYLINSTLSGNRAYYRAALEECSNNAEQGQRYAHLNVINTIVSGNTAEPFEGTAPPPNNVPDLFASPSSVHTMPEGFKSSINGTQVYDHSGTLLTDVTFNPAEMLAPYLDGVIRLQGTGNPAETVGMNTSELQGLDLTMFPDFEISYLGIDQKNNPRDGRQIGACVD